QQPLLMTDVGAYERSYPRSIADLRQHGIKTLYMLPLTSAGRRLGALGFGSLQERAWSEEDQEILQQVAKLVAVAVDNAINFESALSAQRELARKLEHLRLMLKITSAVVSHLNLRELLQIISSNIREVMGADTAGVGLYDHESGQLRAFATEFPDGPGFQIPLEG